MIGICQFCEQKANIKRSHAIANTIFRKILKKCDGNAATTIKIKDSDIKLSNDSWATQQLCGACESFFNSKYEDYSIHVLREEQKGVIVKKHPYWISFQNVNQCRLILYFLSIYWRAGWSKHSAHDAVIINQGVSDYLKGYFLGEQNINSSIFNVRICKLVDKSSGFSEDALKEIIINPFNRIHSNNSFSTCFLFEGYFCEIFFKAINFKERNKIGYLRKSKTTLLVPFIDIFDIPEVVNLFKDGLEIYRSQKE